MYNPGRYDGIVVLDPTKYGFEDFGSLPTSGESTGRFYGAHLTDVDGDRIYEIVSEKTLAIQGVRTEELRLSHGLSMAETMQTTSPHVHSRPAA